MLDRQQSFEVLPYLQLGNTPLHFYHSDEPNSTAPRPLSRFTSHVTQRDTIGVVQNIAHDRFDVASSTNEAIGHMRYMAFDAEWKRLLYRALQKRVWDLEHHEGAG